MESIVVGGAGFLLAVLWFDLMFDVQARGPAEQPVPDEALESIAGYYRRVTTDASPMNRLVSVAMLVMLGGIVAEMVIGSVDVWVGPASLVLGVPPIVLAGARIFPAARRLGAGTIAADQRSATARSILRGHLYCFASIGALLVVQAVSVGRS